MDINLIDKNSEILSNNYKFIINDEDDILTAIISDEAMGENTFEVDIIVNDSETPITIRVHSRQKMSDIRDIVEDRLECKIFSFHSSRHWDVHRDHMDKQTLRYMLIDEPNNVLITYTLDYEKTIENITNRMLWPNGTPRYPIYGGYAHWLQALEKL